MCRVLYRAILVSLCWSFALGFLSPAAAVDCIPKIEAVRYLPAPHPRPAHRPLVRRAPARHATAAPHRARRPSVHRIGHVIGHVRPVRHGARKVHARHEAPRPAALNPSHRQWMESSEARQTLAVYVGNPVSCDLPSASMRSAPPETRLAPAQRLLDEISGPNPPPLAPTTETNSGPFPGVPYLPGGFGGGGGTPGVPGGPGGPNPPPGPPVPPHPPNPPVGPPPGPPGPPNPPGPPGPPGPPNPPGPPPPPGPPGPPHPPGPPGPPPCCGPVNPPPPPPVGAVPEPGTWALLLVGFFGLGAALRNRRAVERRRKVT